MIQHPSAEVDIVDHCNLRCKNCCHRAPQSNARIYPLEDFKRDIDLLAGVIHYNAFRVLGGEPLLNQNCLQYLQYIKASGLTDRIELITNGTLLPSHKDTESIVDISDVVWISRYETLPTERLARLDKWCSEHAQEKIKVVVKHEFWEMYHPEGQTAEETRINHANCDQWQICNLLYHGFLYPCAAAARWEHQPIAPVRVDLQGPALELRLRHFMDCLKVFPPSTCAICQRRKLVPHAFES